MVDEHGKIVLINRLTEQLFGYERDELIGTSIEQLVPDKFRRQHEQYRMTFTADAQQRAMGAGRDLYGRRKDATEIPVEIGLNPIRTAEGLFVVAAITDISERKKVEERLRRTEKMAAVGQLGATIAHELNNPLEAVTNLAYLMRKNKSLDEKARKQLELLNQELNRMADMTRRTLGFYRDSSSAVPVVLGELMDEVLALYARKIESKRIDLQREYQTHAEVSAFPGEMRKVFSNLIANAIDAVAGHGRITVRVRNASAWRNGAIRGVRVAVADSGSGIGPADRNRIFEPFYTTKKDSGTGLGLWLTRDIVRSHGGSISVRSSISAGRSCRTVFSVFIPAQKTLLPGNVSEERRTA